MASFASIASSTDSRMVPGKTNYRFASNSVLGTVTGLDAVACNGTGGCIIGASANGMMGAECNHNRPGVGSYRTFALDQFGISKIMLRVAEVVQVGTPTTGLDDIVMVRYEGRPPIAPMPIVEKISWPMANMPVWFDTTGDEFVLQEVRQTSVTTTQVGSGDNSKFVVKCDLANQTEARKAYTKGCGFASSQTAFLISGNAAQFLGVVSWMWWLSSQQPYSTGWMAYTDAQRYIAAIKSTASKWGMTLNLVAH